ncbi:MULTISPECIES: hypothetical protein [Alphaproteobacteria]|uniref:hypothetical protein n=1 Tax=Alphaproteobacteria TaxID=28211 RepID=UPI000DB12A75|nr:MULTISPECIES: hypothetical protein [Alphaproteobacteria]MBY0302716.1 hypothetical protein [Sphingomonas ginsenosidimutans]PZP65978.1 MAG: hypothetical protein DI590_25570 [Methylorubrum populi]
MRTLLLSAAATLALLAVQPGDRQSRAAAAPSNGPTASDRAVTPVAWTVIARDEVAALNRDVVAGKPTMDVGVYLPANYDPAFKRVTLETMLTGLKAAKKIYAPVGVQINILWIKTGAVNPRYLSIQASELGAMPDTEYLNLYEANARNPSELTRVARDAFTSIIEPGPDSHRTILLVALQDVVFPIYEFAEGRKWNIKVVRTGGLSFPTYSFPNALPPAWRGVITITNLSTPRRLNQTIAHEIGHKVMNVSHEYKTTEPAQAVYADGGLMLYGNGTDIPSGAEGRWHRERLMLSPFLYRTGKDGKKQWNADYKEGGHYYDPLYDDKVVRFAGKSGMAPDW